MARQQLVTAFVVLAAAVVLTVWPVRSRRLFSWDSANYAFAADRIDIAAHRPHPPGYLGYVFAARGLQVVTRDINTALVSWNVLILPVAAIVTALLGLSMGLTRDAALAASVLVITSPLVWFYTSVAEIYVSELLWAGTIALAAHLTLRGRTPALYWCAAALAGASIFKLSTAALMLPLAFYAWYRSPRSAQLRALILLAVLMAIVATVFLAVQHDYVSLVWAQFTTSTAGSRVSAAGRAGAIGVVLNRNIRDTFTAFLAALGFVNALALVVWAIFDRRRPAWLNPMFAAAWLTPWLAVFIGIHIGKPGYVLTLLPLLFIVIAAFYARHGRAGLVLAVAAQLLVNVLQVTLLSPASPDAVRYRDKTLVERWKSDLQPLTFPTLATIRDSDRHVDRLIAFDRSRCPSGRWVAVSGIEWIDWRRAMFYLPSAQVIRLLPAAEFPSIGVNGDFHDVSPAGTRVSSDCGLLWIGSTPPVVRTTAPVQPVEGVGWLLPAGTGVVTPKAIEWIASR